jgi:gamma-glutamylcyclotransferase (GGCT)/AIG2-like uncharacterized protein YtfP
MLRVFVYGTLKRGQRNHDRFCRGVRQVYPATVVGRLYQLAGGYPMLQLPAEAVLAVGSTNYLHDATLQERHYEIASNLCGDDWELVQGEVLEFDDPAERLPRLDMLEGFRPTGSSGYHRVLARTELPDRRLAWTYIAPEGQLPIAAWPCGIQWSG